MSNFHSLIVSEVKKITPNAVAIGFSVPENLHSVFRFKAGQYVTIKHPDSSIDIRRAYSICSSPGSGHLRVGIKKIQDGVFSTYAYDKIEVGTTLEVMPPEGNFVLETNPESSNHYLAFAAGSGITPILSIVTTALDEEPNSTVSLCFGNRSLEETMFAEELEELQKRYPDRLFLEYIFSRRQEPSGLFGRIDRSTVNYLLKNRFSGRDYNSVFICGPEPMIHTVSEVLQESGFDKGAIKYELFTTSDEGTLEQPHDGATKITVVLDDEAETFTMPQKKSILDAALDQGLDVPYSCQGGICSSCIARITHGSAEMKKNQILTDSEIEEGLILTCQAHPNTPEVHVDYDDV